MASGTTRLADRADLFLHRISFNEALASIVPVRQPALRAASFLDGRTDFSAGPAELIPFDDLVASPPADAAGPDRYLFHVSFCGSTLLSRLLDRPGRAMVLREPQCLADIAGYGAALDQQDLADANLGRVLPIARAWLRRRWQPDEPVLVKPTNWVNTLIPALCSNPSAIRPVFLTMDRRAFLLAVFRGGQDRLAFTARAAVHVSSAGRQNAERVAAALARGTDQLGTLSGLAALAHGMQEELFRSACAAGGWGEAHWLTMEGLLADPVGVASRAAAALDLSLSEAEMAEAMAAWGPQHAKQPELGFSPAARACEDEAVESHHGRAIDAALRWAETVLG